MQSTTTPQLTLSTAKSILSKCHLHICKDRHFGDMEFYYNLMEDNTFIAEGYRSSSGEFEISFLNTDSKFKGQEAKELYNTFYSVSTSYNDLSGE